MTHDPRPALLEILRELNPSATTDALHGYAESLYMMNVFGAIGDLPRARNAGCKKAGRELERAASKAAQLAKALSQLPSDALRAFEKAEPNGELHPVMLLVTLCRFAESAQRAGAAMLPTPPYEGNRPRVQPMRVARIACEIFKRLTGEKGGRVYDSYGDKRTYGPLLQFVTDVFRALDIQASADSQLKAALSSRLKEKRPAKLG